MSAPIIMTFKVEYNYKPRSFDENGKYVDNDTYTITIDDFKMNKNENGFLDMSMKTIKLSVNEKEIYELYRAIKDAIADRDDTRGYHE